MDEEDGGWDISIEIPDSDLIVIDPSSEVSLRSLLLATVKGNVKDARRLLEGGINPDTRYQHVGFEKI